LLLPTVLLWMSTVYLRYHYVVDLAGGLLVCLAGIAASRLYERSELATRINCAATNSVARSAEAKNVSTAPHI
ncbi:MAG TPA: hypothetical protein VHE37_04060, partial [Nevskiaceae bacterium]|nr:hypothetical protein [Nevskiaceae bacterium]